jgi:hypothetical protein
MPDPRNPYGFTGADAGTMPGASPQAPPYSLSSLAPNQAPAYAAPWGVVERGNVDLAARPRVQVPGTKDIATVRSMGINVDGNEVLIPTVSDDGRLLSPQQAIDLYRKTGRHLGVFKDRKSADAYAEALHQQQAKDYRGR